MKNFTDDRPIYVQIKEEIEEAVLARRISEGELIPSIRNLSTQYRVNPNTIGKAFTELESLNIIFKKRGIGFFVKDGARAMLLKDKKYEFINKDLKLIVKKAKIIDITLDVVVTELKKIYQEG